MLTISCDCNTKLAKVELPVDRSDFATTCIPSPQENLAGTPLSASQKFTGIYSLHSRAAQKQCSFTIPSVSHCGISTPPLNVMKPQHLHRVAKRLGTVLC